MTTLDEEIRALRERIAELEAADVERQRAERLQSALYRIAETAGIATDMQDFYARIHAIVRELMYAENLFIALYDDERDMINFPYYVDLVDEDIPDPNVWEPYGIGNAAGVTARMLRDGRPIMLTPDVWDAMFAAGEIEAVGVVGTSWLGTPLVSDKRIVGGLVVQSYREDRIHTSADMELLTFVARHIASALERTRLIDETRQRNAELALINDIQRGLAQNLEMQAMYDLVGDRLVEIFDAQVVDIGILDEVGGVIRFPYAIERGQRFPDEPLEVIGFRRHVLTTREPLVVGDAEDPAVLAMHGQPDAIQGEPARSLVLVPLVVGDRATGVISLQNLDRANAFSDADVRLLTTLAGSLSVSLENARLFEEARQRNAELAVITDVQRGLAENLEMHAMYQLVGERIREIFDAQVIDIGVLNPSTGLLEQPYANEKGVLVDLEPAVPSAVTEHVMRGTEPLLLSEHLAERVADLGGAGTWGDGDDETPASWLLMPLIVGGEAIGRISLQNMDDEDAFSEGDVRLLATIARSLSIALENASLFEETRQRNAELAVITEVQRGLAENLDMRSMYELVGDRIQEIFAAYSVDIALVDVGADVMRSVYMFEHDERLPDEPFEIMGVTKHVLETREAIVINDRMEERLAELGGADRRQGDLLAVGRVGPAHRRERGDREDLPAEPRREHAFSDADVRLLTTIAGSLSVALENARLFEETRQRNAELAVITDVQRALAENLDMQAMYELVGDRIQEIFDAQVVDIGIVDPTTGCCTSRTRSSVARGSPISRSTDRRVRGPRDGDPAAVRRQRGSPDGREEIGGGLIQGDEPRSVAYVPLVLGDRATGRISLQNLDHEHAFSESDVRLLHDDRRQPQRRARERSAVRGDEATQCRARAHQRRAARARREPRHAGDVRPRRRPDPGDLRRAGRRHRHPGSGATG